MRRDADLLLQVRCAIYNGILCSDSDGSSHRTTIEPRQSPSRRDPQTLRQFFSRRVKGVTSFPNAGMPRQSSIRRIVSVNVPEERSMGNICQEDAFGTGADKDSSPALLPAEELASFAEQSGLRSGGWMTNQDFAIFLGLSRIPWVFLNLCGARE
jgi:hypothetical protein